MENTGTDYRKRYEETLLTLAEKEDIISDLKSELDKLRRHLFGSKSEKRDGHSGENQLGLFELGTTQAVQEELSESVAATEKSAPKKRAKLKLTRPMRTVCQSNEISLPNYDQRC